MVPEILELRISRSPINKRYSLREDLNGISFFGITREAVPL
jgi:hypothetical protein